MENNHNKGVLPISNEIVELGLINLHGKVDCKKEDSVFSAPSSIKVEKCMKLDVYSSSELIKEEYFDPDYVFLENTTPNCSILKIKSEENEESEQFSENANEDAKCMMNPSFVDLYKFNNVSTHNEWKIENEEVDIKDEDLKQTETRLSVAARELQESDKKFLAFYRMSKNGYLNLVEMLCPAIQKKNTNMRECVSADERILITLRYLATGDTFVNIGFYFARGDNTVSLIIAETTVIIWNVLNETYMPNPNIAQWKNISERYRLLYNLPNCIGSLDGKHIRIEKFPNSGSSNFNYKSYHSIVLMACSDADGIFTLIECGYAGRNSDGGIFRASAIKHWIENDSLNIPAPSSLPNDGCNFPYYFVGDEAFPLKRYLMRPYPQRTLDNVKRVFNYRLSRGRKTVECAFGMMAEKFAVLGSPIRCHDPEKVTNIVKSVCILHNYVRKREGIQYNPQQFEANRELVPDSIPAPQNLQITALSSAYNLRDYLANYFITPHAALPWQWNYIL